MEYLEFFFSHIALEFISISNLRTTKVITASIARTTPSFSWSYVFISMDFVIQ